MNTDECQKQYHESLSIKELLARIDERTNFMISEIQDIKKNYITRSEFTPIQKAVYGTVSLLLTAIIIALVALVLR